MLRPTGMYSAAGPYFTRHQLHHIAPLSSRVWPSPSVVSPSVPRGPAPSRVCSAPGLGSWTTVTSEPSHSPHPPRLCRCHRGLSTLPVVPLASEEGKLSTSQDAACRTWRRALRPAEGKSVAPGPQQQPRAEVRCLLPAGRLQPCPALSPGSREGAGLR